MFSLHTTFTWWGAYVTRCDWYDTQGKKPNLT